MGVPATDLVGRDFTGCLAAGSRIFHDTHFAPLLTLQGKIEEVAAELVDGDGHRLPVLMSSVLVDGPGEGADVIRTSVMHAPDRRRFEAEVQTARRRAEASQQHLEFLARLVAALAEPPSGDGVARAAATVLGATPDNLAGLWLPSRSGQLVRPAVGADAEVATVALEAASPIAAAWRTSEAVVDEPSGTIAVPASSTEGPAGVVVLRLADVRTDGVDDEGVARAEATALAAAIGQEVGQALERARLFERKDWLLGVAAHDLRTPLTVMIGNAETLQRLLGDDLTARDAELLARIVTAGRGMASLIDDVLDLSSVESGMLSLDTRPDDVGDLVSVAVDDHGDMAAAKSISLELGIESADATSNVDRQRVRQVIDNLLSNAIKYTQPGTTVTVRVSSDDDRLWVSVRDEGEGIPEDELDQVFNPFQRTSTRPTAGESSTGLGLSIARSIVEAHGGVIEVVSTPGVGSEFRFSLPHAATT